MEKLKEGDFVEVYDTRERRVKGIILHTPSDVGDLLQIDCNGSLYAFNTGATDFSMVLRRIVKE